MQLKSKAQLAKAKRVKEELKVWKAHLRKLKGGKKKATGKRKPLSATRQKKFVRKAVNKPGKDIDDLIFENGKVIERKVSIKRTKKKAKSPYGEPKAKQPYAKNPYAESPYHKKKGTKRRGKKKHKIKSTMDITTQIFKEMEEIRRGG